MISHWQLSMKCIFYTWVWWKLVQILVMNSSFCGMLVHVFYCSLLQLANAKGPNIKPWSLCFWWPTGTSVFYMNGLSHFCVWLLGGGRVLTYIFFFYKKSLNMGPVFYKKILKHGSNFLTEPKFLGFHMAKTPKITNFVKTGPIFQEKSLTMGTLFCQIDS